jgi:hypothetical protein
MRVGAGGNRKTARVRQGWGEWEYTLKYFYICETLLRMYHKAVLVVITFKMAK